ncbi:MAG: molybdopterin molybdotransferase MoeA [Acidobacteria bacterium]|nr:molybdopterin molybdotransferase MoeA [Acidobacteriota bacterium]
MHSYHDALAIIRQKMAGAGSAAPTEILRLEHARGRVLAEDIAADRDYPPFHRSTRDGFAVRSPDLSSVPATLTSRGEVRAGEHFDGKLGPGECVAIMTGAPLPAGTDAVVMLEHARMAGSAVTIDRAVTARENVVEQGSEALKGAVVLRRGRRLGTGEIGLLASVGKARVQVFVPPQVAILPTGDEVVPVDRLPEWFQIRNSNALALAAQVSAAGGVPQILRIAPDSRDALRRLIEEGLESDLLVLTGGVSKGKYDYVRNVMEELGAEFHIEGVAIRPGKPLVFGRLKGKWFFGLPGNPVSTFVTFEVFARPAMALLAGAEFEEPIFLRARLAESFRQKLGLTVFVPARVETRDSDPIVKPVGWQGSGDLVGVAAANCFLVIHPEQTDLAAGEWVDVLIKRW